MLGKENYSTILAINTLDHVSFSKYSLKMVICKLIRAVQPKGFIVVSYLNTACILEHALPDFDNKNAKGKKKLPYMD